MRAVFVVNPASDGGGTGKAWPDLAREARALGIEVIERRTGEPGEATALTSEALDAGAEVVVAVGGDGTVNEVVNGFLRDDGSPRNPSAALGVVERGTGRDFIRTHGIPKRERDALRLLVDAQARPIDLGRVTCESPDGARSRLYANAASCGMTGDVARRANASTKRLGGTLGFLHATATAFMAWQNVEFTIRIDGHRRELIANNVICANGRYIGGGIKIAPNAEPDDGQLDVLVIGDVGKVDLALNVHRMYRGTLARHPHVVAVRGAAIEVEPQRPLPVECDGELPGVTPARFEIVPHAIRLLAPPGA